MHTDDAPAADHLLLDEADARRLLLVRALEEGDPQGRLVGRVEREQADSQAVAEAGDPARGQPLDERRYLLARAGRLAGLLADRQPALGSLLQPPRWQAWLTWGLPLLAFVSGALIDRIDNPRQVNLLSPPLLAFLLWNLVVYLLLAVLALRARATRRQPEPLLRRWAARPAANAGVGATVAARFQQSWWTAAGPLEGQRWRAVLHASAAAWAVGVAVSIVLGGLVREYRVGWESTLLDLPQVHAFLRVLFAPAVAVLPVEPFSQAELARLHFASGVEVGRAEARRWVALYVALLAIVVVLPRLVLAAWAAARHRALMGRIRVDLGDGYFTEVLGRVRPARVVVGIADAGEGPHPLETTWLQMAGRSPPAVAGEPWTVLRSGRGDTVQVVPWRPAAPASVPAAGWWQRVRAPAAPALERRSPHVVVAVARPGHDGVPAGLAEAKLPLLVVAAGGSEAALVAQLRQAGTPAKVIPATDLPTWREDERLLLALQALLPPYLAPGWQRLRESWRERAAKRLEDAAQLLADELVQAAVDVQELASQPLGVRQLVLRGERDATSEARRQAYATLLARARERRAAADADLLALHALGGLAPAALLDAPLPERFRVDQAVHEPQAGLAGAAGGAAMGAAVDLATGGLTLGAASALGALIGGGAALAAAVWKNRGTDQAVAVVAFGDEMLDAFARDALLRYLAVAHERRAGMQDVQRWADAVDAALAKEQEAFRGLWRRLRGEDPAGTSSRAEAAAELAQRLRALAAGLLDSLGGPL